MANPIRCPVTALEVEHDGKQFGTFVLTAPVAHTLDDVLSPDYFGKVQSRGPADRWLRPGDFIDVRPADWSWYVRLMVRACTASVDKVITAPVSPPVVFEPGDLPAGWTMQYMGIERKWTVYYRGDERAATFRTSEEAREKIFELGGEPEAAAPKNKGGRPKKAEAPAKEPEPV